MNKEAMFSSKSDEWETPQDLFDKLDYEFDFDLDPCATKENHKCSTYFTKKQNGLTKDWAGHRVFCNPPYGRSIGEWVEKAYVSVRKTQPCRKQTVVVLLLPARTDTKWFHDYIYGKAGVEVRFLKGRLKFGNSPNSAPFPSMIVVMESEEE